MSDANHVGNCNDMVVGDNDHEHRKLTLQLYRFLFFRIDLLIKERDAAIKQCDALIMQRFEVDEREETLRLKIESAWRSERDEAIQQRDEARREVCEGCVQQRHPPMQHAIDRGWDCYKKEETP